MKALLNGRSPEAAARQYVTTTKLKDVAERKRLAASAEAVKSSNDGMIRLALLLDPRARELRQALRGPCRGRGQRARAARWRRRASR